MITIVRTIEINWPVIIFLMRLYKGNETYVIIMLVSNIVISGSIILKKRITAKEKIIKCTTCS